MLEALYELGCRNCQLIHLRKKDFKKDDLVVYIKGKRDNERLVPMERKLFNEIYNYVENNGMNYKKEFVFVNPTTQKPWSDKFLNGLVKDCYKEVINGDKHVTTHTYRRSFATNHYNNGVDLV